MTYTNQLLETAKKLIKTIDEVAPSASDRNRAVSTAYYVLFDFVCRSIANRMISEAADLDEDLVCWTSVYRHIDHKDLRDSLFKISNSKFWWHQFFATTFNRLYEARVRADYDVRAAITLEEAEKLILEVENVLFAANSANGLEPEVSKFISALIVELFIPKPKR